MADVHSRLEVIGKQKALFGAEDINLTQFKNLKEKRELKDKVKKLFDGEMIRSIITPREVDKNIRLNKLERQHQSGNRDSTANVIERADSFGKKTLNTLSTFPSVITISYTKLLSKEGDKVYDPFMGHNSRGEDIVALGRKYYAYDVHKFPVDFTKQACLPYGEQNFELNLGSSEKIKYQDETFDFAITCPPYADVEQYNKIYEEKTHDDLSSKDYEEFLTLYKKCLSETYRVLKRGAFFVIVVGDVHRQGKYTSLSNDTAVICQELGFIFHDENIYNRKSNIGGDLNYKTFILTCKRFPTIHEYILIFQKPHNQRTQQKTSIKFIPPNPLDEINKIPEINELERARALRRLKLQQKQQPSTEAITIEKDSFDDVMKSLNIKVKKCKYCNKPISKDNFGIITKDTFICNNITCLFEAFEKLDQENGGNENGK